jgi:hypothetical protein
MEEVKKNQGVSMVVTGLVRFSYEHVFEPHGIEEGKDKKYSVVLLIPKSDKKTLNDIRLKLNEVKEKALRLNNGKLPAKFRSPIKDGDDEESVNEENKEAYSGHFYINASSKRRPNVVDVSMRAIINPEEFYSGCYGRAGIDFYYYNTKGNVGIGCALNNVQKIRDGEPLTGRPSVERDFADSESFNENSENDWM